MGIRPLLCALSAALVLGGCASMSESQCKVADWGRVGLDDGVRGESEQRLAAYTEDCGKVGVRPNAQAYRQGWDAGIQRFCTPQGGWQAGTGGSSEKADRCRGRAGDTNFLRYYQAGRLVYDTQSQMRRNEDETRRLESDLKKATKDDERARLRDRLRSIDRDQSRLRSTLSLQQMAAP